MVQNPWKKFSKVNPQREDGNRQISTKILEALISANLSSVEYKIVLFVIHKTWGFKKHSDPIPVIQFVQACKVSERAVWDNLRQLKSKKILFYSPSERVHRGSPLNEYLFNKHYDTWYSGTMDEIMNLCGKAVDNPVDKLFKTQKKGAK